MAPLHGLIHFPVGPARLQRAIERLLPEQQAVLRLRFIEGRSTAEAARALGTTEQSIKQHQANALMALRAELAQGRVR